MKNIPGQAQKIEIITVTLLMIGLAFLFFFLLHTRQNEKEFDLRCYRDIDRVAKNYAIKLNTYKKNADHIVRLVGMGSSEDIQEVIDPSKSINTALHFEYVGDIVSNTIKIIIFIYNRLIDCHFICLPFMIKV